MKTKALEMKAPDNTELQFIGLLGQAALLVFCLISIATLINA